MVAPRLPSHSKRKRRKRAAKPNLDPRVLLIPILLATLAIGWNVVRLFRSLLQPKSASTPTHRDHTKTSSWNYDWCEKPWCFPFVALDLQDLLEVFYPEGEEESLFEDLDISEMFEFDDDRSNDNNQQKSKNVTTTKANDNSGALTDDLDNHPDRFGRLVIDSARFDSGYRPTPRVLAEARRNKTKIERNATHLRSQLLDAMKGDHFAMLSRRGLGDGHFYNQDRGILIDPYPVFGIKKSKRNPLSNNFFLGIFDGHGLSGHVKADHAASALPNLLLERLSHYSDGQCSDSQIRQEISTVFWQVHRQGPLIHDSGCTASVILQLQQHLYFANVGDSRSMLVRVDPQQHYVNISHITMPHKPNDPKERERIVHAGCAVIDPIPYRDSTARVTESLEGPGMALAMSRSIGDYDLEHCGVIPEATVTVVDLAEPKHDSDNPILLAVSMSDGILDMVSLREVAHGLAAPFWNPSTTIGSFASPLELAVEDLIRTASDRWLGNTTFVPYRDDITLAVRRVQ